jgi:hypothetical protein
LNGADIQIAMFLAEKLSAPIVNQSLSVGATVKKPTNVKLFGGAPKR